MHAFTCTHVLVRVTCCKVSYLAKYGSEFIFYFAIFLFFFFRKEEFEQGDRNSQSQRVPVHTAFLLHVTNTVNGVWMEKVLSGSHFSTFFQHSTISHALSPVMNNSLHAMFVTTCASRGDPLSLSPLLKCTTHSSLCSHPPFGLHKHSPTINERQRVQLYSCMEEFNDTSFLHLHFHVRCHSVRLPLFCYLSCSNNT